MCQIFGAILRCRLSAWTIFSRRLFTGGGGRHIAGRGRDGIIPTLYRVDENGLKEVESQEVSSRDSSIFRNRHRFVRDILQGENVIVRITLFDGDSITAHFKVGDLPDKIGLLPCWPDGAR